MPVGSFCCNLSKKPFRRNFIIFWTNDLAGLKNMMVLFDNWDIATRQNKIVEDKRTGRRYYIISDLGATFGTPGMSWTEGRSKGNLKSYSHSAFISKKTPEYVDFATPSRITAERDRW